MKTGLLVFMGMGAVVSTVSAQQQPQAATPLAVGVEAPDFTLPSATKDGVGKPVSLRDYRGQVVVLAFFFRARTPG